MSDASEVMAGSEPAVVQPVPGPPPDVHLPGPSIWPIVVAAAVFMVAIGLAWETEVATAGLALGAAALWGWLKEANPPAAHPRVHEEPTEEAYVHMVVFRVPEKERGRLDGPGGLLAQLEAQSRRLAELPGFLGLRVLRTVDGDGEAEVVVECAWRDRDSLADYEEGQVKPIEDVIEAHRQALVSDSLQAVDWKVE